jgi:hypothetical protein
LDSKSLGFSSIVIPSLVVCVFTFAVNGIASMGEGIPNLWQEDAIEVLILIATSILAGFLFVISFIAYRNDRRKKLLFITSAFFLFALKGVLLVFHEFLEVLYVEESLIEPIAQLLDFGILALFFLGLMKTRV